MALAVCVLLIAGMAAPFFVPGAAEDVRADGAAVPAAGEDLEIRVGYFGDDKDYRTKAVLTRADLEAISEGPYYYSNVTRVGTVMGTVGRGPTITSVLEAAGIDLASVQTINLRTTDGKKVNNWFVSLNMDQWINSTRWYYPELRANYERIWDEEDPENGLVLPLTGSLADPQEVPAILAIESFTTKSPDEELDPALMDEANSYRFCAGQTQMEEEVECGDVSSMNSAKWIFGIDVQLYGSPANATGLDLSLDNKNLKVGSKAQVKYQIYGAELFDDKVSTELIWTSSDPSIATVDANGLVTILKKGTVTITATTKNGISKSVTINATEKKKKKKQQEPEPEPEPEKKKEPEKKEPEKKKEEKKAEEKKQEENIILYQPEPPKKEEEKAPEEEKDQKQEKKAGPGLREILLEGDMYDREEMSADATPLDAQQRSPIAGTVAACGCYGCIAAGGLVRLIKYLKEVL